MSNVHHLHPATAKAAPKRLAITSDALRSLSGPPGTRLWDTTAGFFAVKRKHSIAFGVQWDAPLFARPLLGKTVTRIIGQFGDDLNPKQARKIAGEWIAKIKNGEDPEGRTARVVADATEPKHWTLQMAFDHFITEHAPGRNVKANTLEIYRDSFARIHPKMKERLVSELALATLDLGNEQKRIRAVVAAKRKGEHAGKNAADASLRLIGTLVTHTWRKSSRATPVWDPGAMTYSGKRRRSAFNAMSLDELPAFWDGVRKHRCAVRRELILFSLLTGLRSENVREAKLADIVDGRLWIKEAKGHNVEKGRIKSFWLPLSTHALACIERAQAARKGEHLFTSPSGGVYKNTTLGKSVNKTPHDLRATFETVAENEGGFSFTTLQRLMGHATDSQTADYGNAAKIVKSPAETAQAIADLIMTRIQL